MNIGPYELLETLGKGTFAKVKSGRHKITGERVAIKIVPQNEVHAEKSGQKLRREVNVQRMFRHPHIVRLFEVIHTSQHMFLVMEHASGGELFECISHQGRLHDSTARRLFQQLISAVEYCHDRGVAHRDLKPENILLHNTDIKIADFGLSNIMRDGEFLRTSCGSPNYAAPEVIAGNLYSGAEADIWSCGVILYAMLVGRLPFDEDSLAVLFRRIKEGKYTIPSSVTAAAADLISRILVVDVMGRYNIPQIKAHPWFQEGLPAYLSVNPTELPELEETTVRAVAEKFGMKDLVSVRRLLAEVSAKKCEVTLESSEDDYTVDKMTPHAVWVAYNIMLNVKSLFINHSMLSQNTLRSPGQSLTSLTPQSFTDPNLMGPPVGDMTPYGSVGGVFLGGSPAMEDSSFLHAVSPVTQSSVSHATTPNMTGWRIGYTCERSPSSCMALIYQDLTLLKNVEWRVIAPFHLNVRHTKLYTGCVVGLQLFKLAVDGPSHPSGPPHAIVDFTIVSGSVMAASDFVVMLSGLFRERLGYGRGGIRNPKSQVLT